MFEAATARTASLRVSSERLRSVAVDPGVWAVLVWLVCLAPALALPSLIDESPFTLQGSAAPLVVGVSLLGIGAALSRWVPGGVLAGAAAGALAGWVVLTMHTGLHGTPYGFNGLVGDTARLSAQAERYTTTLHSADGIVSSVPAEYPPLWPWLIGRAAVIAGVPAWKLLGISETLLMSAVIVASFVLWRRMCSPWVALAITAATFVVFIEPDKPYEVMGLDLMIPWALATFAAPPRGRLHWLPAGVIGGLLILTYQLYLIFAALAIVALVVLGFRRARSRRPYVGRLAGVVIVAFIVGSWYLLPYLSWGLSHGLQNTAVYYPDVLIARSPFPFLEVSLQGALTAIGLLGLVWYFRRSWWAMPLALLTLSAYIYRFVAEVVFIPSGNTLLLEYTTHAVAATLSAAGVLTLARAVPALLRRLSVEAPAGVGTVALSALLLWVGTTVWYDWMPARPAIRGPVFIPALTGPYNEASNAFLEPLPDGSYPRFAPARNRVPWFPTDTIVADVRSVLGPRAAPVTVSSSERLFAIQPWPGYIGVGAKAAAATSNWTARFHALLELSRVTNPVAFAQASAHTRFGPIDAFVLSNTGRYWFWTPLDYDGTVRFTPAQFSSPAFRVFSDLPDGVVLAVRTYGSVP